MATMRAPAVRQMPGGGRMPSNTARMGAFNPRIPTARGAQPRAQLRMPTRTSSR